MMHVDPNRAAWLAYDVRKDGTVTNGRVFFDATRWRKDPFFGPEGFKVDRQGNIFGARPGGLSVIAPDGTLLARIIHECRREAFETEARRGFSQVRPTEAYLQSVEEAEREKPRRARGSDDVAGIHE